MNKKVQIAGVCGYPVHHSLSPLLHSAWLNALNIEGFYYSYEVLPSDAIRAFRSLKKTDINGVNVTLPLKRHAFLASDTQTEQAQMLGVANCLYVRDGQLTAHNTDLEGFLDPLVNKLGIDEILKLPAIVIGTGGVARAAIWALLSINHPEIRVTGRSNDKLLHLIQEIGKKNVRPVYWKKRKENLQNPILIINATSAGMVGKPCLDLDLSCCSNKSFIYDLVYTPIETELLINAKAQGCKTLGGLDMLIAQARPSFELFYNQEPPRNLNVRKKLIKTLEARL
jgi:shikimate dehydrogenase